MERSRGRDGHPVALVTLPDGQQIYASVLARSRSWDGAWWYRVHITLTAREQRPGAPDRAQPYEIEFEVRHPAVAPVEGQDYSQLSGTRRPPGLLLVRAEPHTVAPAWRSTGKAAGPSRRGPPAWSTSLRSRPKSWSPTVRRACARSA